MQTWVIGGKVWAGVICMGGVGNCYIKRDDWCWCGMCGNCDGGVSECDKAR